MLSRLTGRSAPPILRNPARPNNNGRLISIAVFLAFIVPLLVTDWLSYSATKNLLTELALSRRESLAHLASVMLREKFDRIVDVGISFATRVQFRKLVEEKKWGEAIKILASAPKDFPYIDTVALFDATGTIWAVTPPIPEVIGQNFAYRDYYKGVSSNWQPYVSDIFKRAPEPRYNVFSVAVPIKSDVIQGTDQNILGIVLLTIKLDTILDWAREIDVGTGGFAYFVDRGGHVAGHPKFSSYGDIVDFSGVPVVQKLLRGERGVEILYNQIEKEERISAYEQVPAYGWGVIVQQPTLTAFTLRKAYLRTLLITDGIILLIACLLVFFILRFTKALNIYHQKEKILLGSIGDALVAIDRWWNIILFNPSAEKLSGWTAAEVMGKPLRQFLKFVRQKDRTENIAFIEEAMLNSRMGIMENHTVLIRKDGVEIPVGDSAAPVFDASSRVNGAILIFRDISREMQIKALRTDFTYASHQLRTPVTKALWSLEVALASKGVAAMREKIALAHTALKSVNKLVAQILDVSNIDQHRVTTATAKVSLEKILQAARDTVAPLVKERAVELHIPKVDLTLQIDPTLLQRIFVEIFDNAVQYSPEHSVVEVIVKKEGGAVTISVHDEGMGIPDAQQALIFTKFFRGENIDATSIIGAGLGLFITKSYITILGGKIWFVSKEKEGTTFFMQLPIKTGVV